VADLQLSAVSKSYGTHRVLDKITFKVNSGECFTLLGPSGCGKTVILRLIAGFESPDEGEVSIGGHVVATAKHSLPPEERHIGVVFQDYAVWPHKTVYENIAYPLEIAKMPHEQIKSAVSDAIDQVNLAGLAQRYPYQLSGGQQQRVALARALVTKPDVMLLDEPLTNLDANLREEMRFEIKELQRKTGTTIFYVTHDQEVALAISDKMAVMDDKGIIRQIGSPDEVYERPIDAFVYQFLGIPNFIPVAIKSGQAFIDTDAVQGAAELPLQALADFPSQRFPGPKGKLACRPMDVILSRSIHPETMVKAKIVRLSLLGPIVDYLLDIGGIAIRAQMQTEAAMAQDLLIEEGQECGVRFAEPKWFSEDGEAIR